MNRTIVAIRRCLPLAACAALAACAPRQAAMVRVKPPPERTPQAAETPAEVHEEHARASKRWMPRSDEVWLIELMAQRLEVVMAAARAREVWGIPSGASGESMGRLAAFTEVVARLGLPAYHARAFFPAQLEAAEVAGRAAAQGARKAAARGASLLSPDAAMQLLDAIDLQFAATLARLRGLPAGRELHTLARKRLEARGIPKNAARLAATPFAQAATGTPPFTTETPAR